MDAPTSYESIGLAELVATYTAAKALETKRRSEDDGLVYVIAQLSGILCQDVDFESPTTASDFSDLASLLTAIQTSMAA